MFRHVTIVFNVTQAISYKCVLRLKSDRSFTVRLYLHLGLVYNDWEMLS